MTDSLAFFRDQDERPRKPGLMVHGIRLLVTLSIIWVTGGAACYRSRSVADFPQPPEVFQAVPSVSELVDAINRTDRITALQSHTVSVSGPDIPFTVNATINLERPKRFRMIVSAPVLRSVVVDLGSNEDVFWLQPPSEGLYKTLYFSRHEDFVQSSQRTLFPIDPLWVTEALGLVHLDPATVRGEPKRLPDGRLELVAQRSMPDGQHRRVYKIDGPTGIVTEQALYDATGRLLARALASEQHYYQEHQCSLPHVVQLELYPAAGKRLEAKVEIGDYLVNQPSGDTNRFAMPVDAATKINISNGGAMVPGTVNVNPRGLPTNLPSRGEPMNRMLNTGPAARNANAAYARPIRYGPSIRGLPSSQGVYRR